MKERIVNVFTYGHEDRIHSFGWTTYIVEGSYRELTAFLQSKVGTDFKTAKQMGFPEPMRRSDFCLALRLGALDRVAPQVVEIVGDSTYCLTHVIDGKPRAEGPSHAQPHEAVPDYLRLYWTTSGFDFGQLIDDDFMDAIKVLWTNQKYVSALKLLFIMIDTLGFVEFGPVNDCFVRWIDRFCDLGSLGVSSEELWELRNSLLHMTNLDSRKVHSGKVKRLLPVATAQQNDIPAEMGGFKNLHMARLFGSVIPAGIVKWVSTLGEDQDKFLHFIQKYDTVISDSRTSVAYSPMDLKDEPQIQAGRQFGHDDAVSTTH